jgi:predicted Rossmann fold nucleotide-binding protein DprA/Smf involved in DNA uptake
MDSTPHTLSEYTQTALLLCGHLLAGKQKGEAPLSPGEFNKLTRELEARGAALPELLGTSAKSLLAELSPELDRDRVEALLGRGFLLSLALEKWNSLGLWVLSREDPSYPVRFKERLQQHAPVILYGCGDLALLDRGGVAIVGSRDVDEAGTTFTQTLAARCAAEGLNVISGGARGVDQIAMRFAAENGGRVVGVMADSLARSVSSANARDLLREGRVTLLSPFDPEAGFNVGNAMARNKCIYALADYGVVVSSGEKEGGTWAGAIEQINKFKHTPIFVRAGEGVPSGNVALIKAGGTALETLPPTPLQDAFQAQSRAPRIASPELLLNL